MKEKLIGKTKEDAINLLKENSSKFRIVSEDGVPYAVTCDYIISRFNLHLNNNLVTNITMG